METASLATVIETLFYILLFYYVFKFVMRLLLPVAVRKVVEKAQEDMGRRQYSQTNARTGETVYQKPPQRPRETKKVGEYVDFEEIE